jgi:hypothetical protein
MGLLKLKAHCKVDGCVRDVESRGWCELHARRFRTTGSVGQVETLREKHGHTKKGLHSREYSTWHSMIQRCTNPRTTGYSHYGGRGISVCTRWRESFNSFLEDMGKRPAGHSLERIDVNGNYEPSNCRWATSVDQGRNKRDNRNLTINGITRTVSDWARESGIKRITIQARLRKGWDAHSAVFTPLQPPGPNKKK